MSELAPLPDGWFTPGKFLRVQRIEHGGLCEIPGCFSLSFLNVLTSEGHKVICLRRYELAREVSRRPRG
jgi:hypothetical protein